MERRPIFVATHTRSCSTAFERIFLTRRDLLTCFHEPFGDAFYYGPEKISPASLRWPADKIQRSGRSHYTYDYVLQLILDANKDPTKRIFLKDLTYHILPPIHTPHPSSPSLHHRFLPSDPPNPTLLPTSLLCTFSFIFLIRRPSASIPSLYRCFIPPLSAKTEENTLDARELGYRETRMLFDWLYPPGSRPPDVLHKPSTSEERPLLIDADDLLSHPEPILRYICARIRLPYSPSMLSWSSAEDQAHADALFKKFEGYHEDALNSTGLRPQTADRPESGKEAKTREEEDEEWRERYGQEAAEVIRHAVDLCQDDYEYLRGFRIRPEDLKGGEKG